MSCHNHEAQPSRGIKGRRGEEQKSTEQMPHMKSQMHETMKNGNGGTALERSGGKLEQGVGISWEEGA